MTFLLDTCVISEVVSTRPNKKVLRWLDDVAEPKLSLSVLTIGEIGRGIARASDGKRKARLEDWLHKQLLPRFAGRILELDIATIVVWAELTGRLDKIGKPMSAIDSLIAATALHHGCILVTRNISDFHSAGIQTLNPWT